MNHLRAVNPEQIASLVRTIVQFGGGYFVGKGVLTGDELTLIVSGVVTLAVTLWGIWARSDNNLIKSAADVPAVKEIVAPVSSAATDPSYSKVKMN
jgi:hypothetical protein